MMKQPLISTWCVAARAVKTGIQSETHIEVAEGLAEGERIVIGNYRAISRDLEDGTEVVVSEGSVEEGAGPG